MEPKFIPYSKKLLEGEELQNESIKHYHFMNSRRTVREFSTEPISMEVIDNIIMSASTAPSGVEIPAILTHPFRFKLTRLFKV